MNITSKLISTDGIIHKSNSSFGNYRVEACRLWIPSSNGDRKIVKDPQLFFKVKEAKDFIKTLPIIKRGG